MFNVALFQRLQLQHGFWSILVMFCAAYPVFRNLDTLPGCSDGLLVQNVKNQDTPAD